MAMHVYVVIAHPNPRSFNHALLEAFAGGLLDAGHTFEVNDLYASCFNPLLEGNAFLREAAEGEGERLYGPPPEDVLREHERLDRADALALIYPVWWTDCPAVLKGWFDRVLTYGYAYAFIDGELRALLRQRKALVIATAGATSEVLQSSGYLEAMQNVMVNGRLRDCGVKEVDFVLFPSVGVCGDEKRAGYLAEARRLGLEM